MTMSLEEQLRRSLHEVQENKKSMTEPVELEAQIVPIRQSAVVRRDADELTVQELVAQVAKIQEVMHAVMKRDEHYGVIPGTGTKPTLLKAGAEKLCLLFRLDPQYEITETRDGQHLTVLSKCTLFHSPTESRRGSGLGSCSTRESKYAWRKGSRRCPRCAGEFIIKGREEYGGGWLCFAKKGGCGAKFKDGDKSIESQETGRVPNEDLADTYNTVLKMANKRSLVAAVLNVTAASDIFTQDLEDLNQAAEELPKITPHGEVEEGKEYRSLDDEDRAILAIQDAADMNELKEALHSLAWETPDDLENWSPESRKRISAAYRRRERQLKENLESQGRI